jgi:hypothetical protein
MSLPAPSGQCRACAHFRNGAAELERAVPGLASLSSGYASVRGDDGLCLEHDRHVMARSGCRSFVPWTAPPRGAAAA